ncbi:MULTISPECIES: hypothetical protein [unclassified Pseudovibrio]|uniref:hypothetical protein n=1 Tax=unclassified Pseudovibrio TaxID=2627060 RepID=UPI0007AE68F5|nr:MULTISPECIES: hypothetical protein [unclassified Pseudovibrio]KZL00474.1 hypothetical protein PsW74_02900 [Pseudovibrio sp. W74]KZL07474.1 hypothetical protein PsAD14_03860 [Pseudovibrio sp. Ad14]
MIKSSQKALNDLASIDREVETLTVSVTKLNDTQKEQRNELRMRIDELQRRRIELSEPRAFREVSAMFG